MAYFMVPGKSQTAWIVVRWLGKAGWVHHAGRVEIFTTDLPELSKPEMRMLD